MEVLTGDAMPIVVPTDDDRPRGAAGAQEDRQVHRAGLAAAALGTRIVMLGGSDGRCAVKSVEFLEPACRTDAGIVEISGAWTVLPGMFARRAYLSSAVLDNHLYAIGGSGDRAGCALNTMEVFDAHTGEWSAWYTMPPMHTKRTLHASVGHDGRVFVCGGFDGLRDLRTVECYDPQRRCWAWKDAMTRVRSYLALAETSKFLYAVGGQDRHDSEDAAPCVLREVERFNLYYEIWEPAPPMLAPRCGLAAAALTDDEGREYVYVCGGSNGEEVVASMERLDVEAGIWEEMPSMSIPRNAHALVALEGRLYAIGGFDGLDVLDTYECFDPLLQQWSQPRALVEEEARASERHPHRVLMVLTSHARLGCTGKPTGWYLSECAHPCHVFLDAGAEVGFASPKGGAAPMDPSSVSTAADDAICQAFLNDRRAANQLANTKPLSSIAASSWDALFFVGGFGTMWDFAEDPDVKRLAAAVWEEGGIIAAVCHGPIALAGVKLSDGTALLQGKAATAFSNAEEDAVDCHWILPFTCEDRLREAGAYFSAAAPFKPHVVVSENRLITGQNPASATAVAQAVTVALGLAPGGDSDEESA